MVSQKVSQAVESQKEEVYQVSLYRFVIVFVYVIASNQNILMWAVFGPITTDLASMYGESITYINFATILISNVAYIPANFIGNYIVDVHGLRVGTIFGSLLGLIGLWIRTFSNHGFIYIFIGQIFAGFAQPYFYSTPQKFSNVWFSPAERSYATTFMSCAGLIGNCIGPLVPQWFMDTDSTDYPAMIPQLQRMMLWTAVFGSVVFVCTVLLIKEKPNVPPSKAAAAEKHNFINSLKQLGKNYNAMIMITATAIVNGGLVTYISTIQQVTYPYSPESNSSINPQGPFPPHSLTPSAIGNIISISTFVGLTGSFIGAFLIHKFKVYNLVSLVASGGAFFFMILNYYAAKSGNSIYLGIAVTAYGTIIAPVLPVALEYGVELAFPVAEATIGGIWFVVNQLFSTIQALIIDNILGDTPTTSEAETSFIIMIICQGLAVIPLFFVRQNLRRAEYEKKEPMAAGEQVKLQTSPQNLEDSVI